MATLRVGNVALHYEHHASDAPPLVLVPGFAADSSFWAGVVALLQGERDVLVVDPRGAGRSDVSDEPLTLDRHVDDLRLVMAAAGISRADVVGHSYGSLVAARLAARQPEAVRCLVLFNAFEQVPLAAQKVFEGAGRFYALSADPYRDLATCLLPWLYSWSFLDPVFADAVELAASYPYKQPRRGYEDQLHALASVEAAGWLAELAAPTLVVAGEHDRLTPPEEAHAVARQIPGATYVSVAGAGHCTPVEQPAACATLIRGMATDHQTL